MGTLLIMNDLVNSLELIGSCRIVWLFWLSVVTRFSSVSHFDREHVDDFRSLFNRFILLKVFNFMECTVFVIIIICSKIRLCCVVPCIIIVFQYLTYILLNFLKLKPILIS